MEINITEICFKTKERDLVSVCMPMVGTMKVDGQKTRKTETGILSTQIKHIMKETGLIITGTARVNTFHLMEIIISVIGQTTKKAVMENVFLKMGAHTKATGLETK